MATVSAIIPTYGRHDLTVAAIEGLARQTRPPDEVIVVDDGSPGAPFAHPDVVVVHHNTNKGFSGAVNSGIAKARHPVLAILNNDVVLAADWLEHLVPVLSEGHIEHACGKLFRPDGLIDGTWDLLSRGGLAWRAGAGREDGPLFRVQKAISLTSFTAFVVLRMAFEKAGSLDESYHSYYEDVEWSLRAAMAGISGRFIPEAVGVHHGSSSSGGAGSRFSSSQIIRNHRRLAHQYLLPQHSKPYAIARSLLRAHFLSHGQWPHIADEIILAKQRQQSLSNILFMSETELYTLQLATGMDSLWNWYFRLAGAPGP